jgi:hypothetical protein
MCIYVCIYRDREQNCISQSVWESYGRWEKKKLETEKYWNNPSMYEYNIMHCIVRCWMLGEHGDRECISNRGQGSIK